MDSSLGLALLPLIAVIAAVVAAAAAGSLVVAWLQSPAPDVTGAVTDPAAAGLLAVGFVSGTAAGRWLPATVLEFAQDGLVAIEDRRVTPDGTEGRHRDIRLVFDADPLLTRSAAEAGDAATGVVASVFSPGLTGESTIVPRGATVEIDNVVKRNRELLTVTRDRFHDAAERYREPRPDGRLRTAAIGGIVAVGLGLLAVFGGDDSIAWIAVIIGALVLALRAVLPRFIPLNAAGLRLRERAGDLRESLSKAVPERPVALARGRVLPWAVLFDDADLVRRFADDAERSDARPPWYRSAAPFNADRLVSCLAVLTAELSQPIRVGGAPLARDDNRFGVPLMDDNKGFGGGYFFGPGGDTGWGIGGGGFDGGGYDGGGFDGGGFDGGGFDGGGADGGGN
ncbi:hypothetical protein ACFPER_02100 [Agromyces aurantiacus]|uniref:DUF2207 domain-containing protein n=1 Tax=Agromyces aurantiacus TaxID=165814 RepID=A0ABV9R5C9_9MICO|nr:hypothetical protein [Agromyces aurantiacus]MBM7505879.1 hypothetical protein [Agromyces aurantiacus]